MYTGYQYCYSLFVSSIVMFRNKWKRFKNPLPKFLLLPQNTDLPKLWGRGAGEGERAAAPQAPPGVRSMISYDHELVTQLESSSTSQSVNEPVISQSLS